MFFGLRLLEASESPICAESLPRFLSAFSEIRDRLVAKFEGGGSPLTAGPTKKHSREPIELRVKGNARPIYLTYTFDETSNLTEHSVALRPVMEGHAASECNGTVTIFLTVL